MVLKTLTRLVGMSSLLFSLGCASAYYNNPCCEIDCRYDAANPLPYAKYDPSVCHSDAATHYLEPKSPVGHAVHGEFKKQESAVPSIDFAPTVPSKSPKSTKSNEATPEHRKKNE